MATTEQLKQVMEKALADVEFRAELIKDPITVVKEMGIELTPEQAAKLMQIDATKMVDIVEKMLSM